VALASPAWRLGGRTRTHAWCSPAGEQRSCAAAQLPCSRIHAAHRQSQREGPVLFAARYALLLSCSA
jgi:hypothetical protein